MIPAGWSRKPRAECRHLDALRSEARSEKGECEACGLTQDLRICLICGHVGCCESRGAHDTEHFRKSGHPFIRPHRSDYNWLWCYACNAFLE